MILTFGRLLELIAPYVGRSGVAKCNLDSPTVRFHAVSLIQEYVHRADSLARWDIHTRGDVITLPRDLAFALKVKINGVVEPTHAFWYEFYDEPYNEALGCKDDWKSGILQSINNNPTICDLPKSGAYIVAELLNNCLPNKSYESIIQGTDVLTGQDIFVPHKDKVIKGEWLDLLPGQLRRTTKRFSRVTNITKNETDDYVRYYYQVDKDSPLVLIAQLGPRETVSDFKRVKILGNRCSPDKCYHVELLGRVKVRSDYHNNDIVPVTNISAIETLAQAKQALSNNDLEAAALKYRVVDGQIDNENAWSRVQDNSLDVDYDTSPGSIEELL